MLAVLLLAMVALVPSLARANDRLHRTPSDEYSRFRWTNSCESVPQKITTIVVVAPVATPVQTTFVAPSRARRRLPPAVAPARVSPRPPAPRPLRAPPALA